MIQSLSVVILAAGKGTRMYSDLKSITPNCGQTDGKTRD